MAGAMIYSRRGEGIEERAPASGEHGSNGRAGTAGRTGEQRTRRGVSLNSNKPQRSNRGRIRAVRWRIERLGFAQPCRGVGVRWGGGEGNGSAMLGCPGFLFGDLCFSAKS